MLMMISDHYNSKFGQQNYGYFINCFVYFQYVTYYVPSSTYIYENMHNITLCITFVTISFCAYSANEEGYARIVFFYVAVNNAGGFSSNE